MVCVSYIYIHMQHGVWVIYHIYACNMWGSSIYIHVYMVYGVCIYITYICIYTCNMVCVSHIYTFSSIQFSRSVVSDSL